MGSVRYEGNFATLVWNVYQQFTPKEVIQEDVSTYDVDYNLPTHIYFIDEHGIARAHWCVDGNWGTIYPEKKHSHWSKRGRKFTKWSKTKLFNHCGL